MQIIMQMLGKIFDSFSFLLFLFLQKKASGLLHFQDDKHDADLDRFERYNVLLLAQRCANDTKWRAKFTSHIFESRGIDFSAWIGRPEII